MAESIAIENVSKRYPAASGLALADVSLHVEPGTFVVLLGPSGSGKTTLLRCLAGIERISSGRIAIGSSTVAGEKVHVPPDRRNLAMVFQDYALWPHLRARDNVAFALRRENLPRPDARARTQAMLERVGLGALADRYPNELSGGEQQRVALARALVAGTGLILCDEPLSNLDADLRERMRVEISSLVREAGATAVYITHDQAEAFALADEIGVLQDGRLIQFGRPEQVYTEPASPFVARFTGLSGELPVRAGDAVAADGTVEIGTAGSALLRPCRARVSGSTVSGSNPAGTDAILMIRPTGVQLCDPAAGDHHLAGTVADVAFRGRGYEHAIDIAGHGRLTGVFAAARAERGTSVGLRLDPSGCHVFAASQDAGAAPGDPADPAGSGSAQPAAVPA
ncbi:MAG TPA: ABC transporter ATP-binding protein [Streptosporangiaceae bacterium]|nr:ABC transporter ATP-binding protein [Streptosporangiaceae bacterium]